MSSNRATGTTPELEALLQQLESFAVYDEVNGGFCATRYRRGHTAQPGESIGFDAYMGYKKVRINSIKYGIAHLVWLWHTGYFPTDTIDHIDRDRSNNRIENLRDISITIQSRNRGKRPDNKSGYTGVNYRKGRPTGTKLWVASIRIDGKLKFLGCHETALEAHLAREEFLRENPQLGFTNSHGT